MSYKIKIYNFKNKSMSNITKLNFIRNNYNLSYLYLFKRRIQRKLRSPSRLPT